LFVRPPLTDRNHHKPSYLLFNDMQLYKYRCMASEQYLAFMNSFMFPHLSSHQYAKDT
jgi:hypothetical protein